MNKEINKKAINEANGVSACLKAVPHTSHLCGFSPLWMRVWTVRAYGLRNAAPQMSQRYGLQQHFETINKALFLKYLFNVIFLYIPTLEKCQF